MKARVCQHFEVCQHEFANLSLPCEGRFKNIKFPRGNYQANSYETQTLYCLFCSPLNFLPHASSKIILNYSQLFSLKAVKVKCKIWKRKQTKTLLIQFQLFIFNNLACLQKYFHGRILSIRVFSSDGHYF